ncbi:MAG: DUF3567 domain-containing protein [Burkholderiales bacterium]|nr:DUF3567 family protein [Burkholderiales bacterium]MDE1926768.1 DUF3567 domain-containing protein [Burkholderiales bacterium]MDE2161087.1 DUF3567 domain-containing protein [Burkholderiales bacterium]MDE2503848.1 DUF3567 domain-containing protein [Burkholderiales bacterium]
MQMLYNSDNFAVVQIDVPADAGDLRRGGYEIVDKFARKDIFIEGALAERFQRGVEELVRLYPEGAEPEVFDDYIAGYAGLAPQPLVRH